MTMTWECPKCGHAVITLMSVAKDHVPGEGVMNGGERRYTPIHCSAIWCEYYSGFPDGVSPVALD